jgi:hypothetical protein
MVNVKRLANGKYVQVMADGTFTIYQPAHLHANPPGTDATAGPNQTAGPNKEATSAPILYPPRAELY